jgi:hypothetical protein
MCSGLPEAARPSCRVRAEEAVLHKGGAGCSGVGSASRRSFPGETAHLGVDANGCSRTPGSRGLSAPRDGIPTDPAESRDSSASAACP